jgi:predicted DNA-binding transcriptional regulator YafY
MSREDRLHEMQRLFQTRRSIGIEQLKAELEVSRATVIRYIGYLRHTFGIPLEWDSNLRGYRIGGDREGGTGLFGLWFSPAELHALLAMDQLIRRIEPGVLKPHLEPIKERLKKILGSRTQSLEELERRVRVLPMTARTVRPKVFQAIVTALLGRKKLAISYASRTDGETSQRTVSPQRLVHYRDNWYLDAWCHTKRSLRMFSVDAIGEARLLEDKCKDMPDSYLSAVLEVGYGIFSGRRTKIARLRFSPARARWVAAESWHPRQVGAIDKQGNYLLKFPYSSHLELVMDLLRHIPEVEVLGPKSLRNHLNARIKAAASRLK